MRDVFTARRRILSAATACVVGVAFHATAIDFRITPSGHDDTAAINSAIQNARPGDNIVLASGAFRISNSIVGKSGIDLLGAGRDLTRIDFVGTSKHPMVSLNNTSAVEVSGLTLNGNSNRHATQGFSAHAANRITLQNLRVNNFVATGDAGPHGVYFSSQVTDSVIRNNDFSNIGANSVWGAAVRLAWGSSRNQVLDNVVTNTGRGGILANDGSTDLLISGNRITGTGLAPNSPGLGIELFNQCDRSIVQDNRLDHWLSLDNTSNTAVRRNTITDTSGRVKFAGLEFAKAGRDTVFTNNVVTGGQQIGISVSGSGLKERVYFAHNTITGMKTWGAQIQGEAGGAKRMYFFANTLEGTTSGPESLYSNQGNGFRFNGNSSKIVLDGNTIRNNGNIGVQLGGSGVDQLELRNNRISSNAGPAITSDFGSVGPYRGEDLAWSNNTVSQNGNNYQLAPKGDFDGNQAPIASIVASGSGNVGEPIRFGFLYGDDGGIGNVLWDFDEGLPSTSLSPAFTYTKPGVYRVGLVVWDGGGRATHDEVMVSVGIVPEPGCALTAIALVAPWIMSRRKRN